MVDWNSGVRTANSSSQVCFSQSECETKVIPLYDPKGPPRVALCPTMTTLPLPGVPDSLNSLKTYLKDQNSKIERLVKKKGKEGGPDPYFTPCIDDAWNTVWKVTWGLGDGIFEGEKDVVRDSGDAAIDDSLLPEPIPPRCKIANKPDGLDEGWRFSCKSFLVRPEYDEAQKAAVQLCGHVPRGCSAYDVIMFSGQPGLGLSPCCCTATIWSDLGSGKSVFLLLLLLRRLAAGLPTALQINSTYALLFYYGGVVNFTRLSEAAAYSSLDAPNPAARIWTLVDSSNDLLKPTGAFSTSGPFYVVAAASPRADRIAWTSKVQRYFFYMKPWSFSEFIQG